MLVNSICYSYLWRCFPSGISSALIGWHAFIHLWINVMPIIGSSHQSFEGRIIANIYLGRPNPLTFFFGHCNVLKDQIHILSFLRMGCLYFVKTISASPLLKSELECRLYFGKGIIMSSINIKYQEDLFNGWNLLLFYCISKAIQTEDQRNSQRFYGLRSDLLAPPLLPIDT